MLDSNPENYINDPNLEVGWAMKAYQHADVHLSLLKAVPEARSLRLTPQDEALYKKFRENFPDFQVQDFAEDEIKSEEAKTKWRAYCNQFQGLVEDYNFATLLRLDANKGYNQANTIIVPRVQFLAMEIARNREGFNDNARNIPEEES